MFDTWGFLESVAMACSGREHAMAGIIVYSYLISPPNACMRAESGLPLKETMTGIFSGAVARLPAIGRLERTRMNNIRVEVILLTSITSEQYCELEAIKYVTEY
jgi:hypothetical protein